MTDKSNKTVKKDDKKLDAQKNTKVDIVNQFDENAKIADNNNNKKKYIIIAVAIIALMLSVATYYFIKVDNYHIVNAKPDTYTNILGEHFKINNTQSKKQENKKAKNKPNKTNQEQEQKQETSSPLPIITLPIKQVVAPITLSKIEPLPIKEVLFKEPINIEKHIQKPTSTAKIELVDLKTTMSKIHQSNKNNQDQIQEIDKDTKASFEILKNMFNAQKEQGGKIVSKVNQEQEKTKKSIEQMMEQIDFLLKQQEAKKETKSKLIDVATFELIGISLWDSKPQATIRYQGKTSIVDRGSVRLNWKITNIDFDKEQITIRHTQDKKILITLEKLR
jgi:hypothetical protein